MMNIFVENYLSAIGRGVGKGEAETQWPLLPSQIAPYFEMEQAVAVYEMLQKLQKTKTIKQIAAAIKYPGIIRNFIRNAGIIGLKVANKVGVKKFSLEEKVTYLQFLLKLIGHMVHSDPLCRDNANKLFSQKQVTSFLSNIHELEPDEKKLYNGLYVTCFGFMWATYFNMLVSGGLEPHGPYDVSNVFGKKHSFLLEISMDLIPRMCGLLPKSYHVNVLYFIQFIKMQILQLTLKIR